MGNEPFRPEAASVRNFVVAVRNVTNILILTGTDTQTAPGPEGLVSSPALSSGVL